MAITKQIVSTADTVTEEGQIFVRTATRVLEDGVQVSETVSRRVLNPGDSLTGESAQVTAVANAVWTADVIAAWKVRTGQPTLEAKKTAMWWKIKAHRDRLSDLGGYKVTVDLVDKWFHSDNKSKIQQLGLKEAGAGIPAGMQWRTMDGTYVTMTPTLAGQIFQAAMAQDKALYEVAATHKANMEAAADPLTYNYSGGWPAVFPGSV